MNLSQPFKFAALSAGIVVAVKLSSFFTHTQFSGIGAYSGLIALGLTGIPLYLGIKDKRDNELDGYITLRQIMIIGVLISIQASILVALYNYIHYSFIDLEVMKHWESEARRLGANENKSEKEIVAAIKMLKEFYAPFKQATVALTGVLGTGTVLSFILSSFLIRKEENS